VAYVDRNIEGFSCLKPFFEAAGGGASTRYFLGYRLKDPGGDLVLFRHDGQDVDGNPRGGAFIFHYAGYNRGQGGDIPQLAPMHNIRNTFLFEVTSQEYKRVEGHVDMMRENGVYNPYYFSRPLSPDPKFETKGRSPTDYIGTPKDQYEYMDSELFTPAQRLRHVPFVATNCVYLATQIMQQNGGIDLEAVFEGMSQIERGTDLEDLMNRMKTEFSSGAFQSPSGRSCLYFDETGQRIINYSKSNSPSLTI
jgi:hypothetical protein